MVAASTEWSHSGNRTACRPGKVPGMVQNAPGPAHAAVPPSERDAASSRGIVDDEDKGDESSRARKRRREETAEDKRMLWEIETQIRCDIAQEMYLWFFVVAGALSLWLITLRVLVENSWSAVTILLVGIQCLGG